MTLNQKKKEVITSLLTLQRLYDVLVGFIISSFSQFYYGMAMLLLGLPDAQRFINIE